MSTWLTELSGSLRAPVARFGGARSRRSVRDLPTRERLNQTFVGALLFLLFGYAIFGKGFAYIGIPPVFIGELVLLLGLLAWMRAPFRGLRLVSIPAAFLMLLIVWGAIRTLPFVPVYKVDALRDGVIWGYGLVALIVARLLGDDPSLFARAVRGYKWLIPVYLTVGVFTFVLTNYLGDGIPRWPLSGVPVIGPIKGGDFLVHLAGLFAFLAATRSEKPWQIIMIAVALALNATGRAGMVSFFAAILIISVLAPSGRAVGLVGGLAVAGLGLLWASGLSIKHEGSGRAISFDQLVTNFQSITSDSSSNLVEGTKKWRLKWWDTIFTYTFEGPYFWTGKGFGINLATDDGFQVSEDESLRSPHNGHLTILARGGVPALALWVGVHGSWLVVMLKAWWRARRRRDAQWVAVFAAVIAYWAAFMVNTSFDVFLEGPVGGIWFWALFGFGLAAVRIADRQIADLKNASEHDDHDDGTSPPSPSDLARFRADAALSREVTADRLSFPARPSQRAALPGPVYPS